jgi:DNA-3-methyladenine glycosylase II
VGPTDADIAGARRALAARDPLLEKADAMAPVLGWRVRERGFAGLVRQVVGQQVSIAAADAILGRMFAGLGATLTPEAVLEASDETLRSFGLSAQKARYVRAIAEAHPLFDAIPDLSDDAAVEALTAIKGVGRWTAETYLMFCEGRLDFFPAGDVALQEGFRIVEESEVRPTEKALYARAEAWRPFRGVAALMLWGVYAQARKRRTETSTRDAPFSSTGETG